VPASLLNSRVTKAPGIETAGFNFATDGAKLQPLMGSVNAPGNPEKDAVAYVAWLDQQPQVNKARKIGTQGYCMGGPLIMRTAAAIPDRVGAAASFHGGGLVTANPNSPHLLIPKMKARMYFGVAANDDRVATADPRVLVAWTPFVVDDRRLEWAAARVDIEGSPALLVSVRRPGRADSGVGVVYPETTAPTVDRARDTARSFWRQLE